MSNQTLYHWLVEEIDSIYTFYLHLYYSFFRKKYIFSMAALETKKKNFIFLKLEKREDKKRKNIEINFFSEDGEEFHCFERLAFTFKTRKKFEKKVLRKIIDNFDLDVIKYLSEGRTIILSEANHFMPYVLPITFDYQFIETNRGKGYLMQDILKFSCISRYDHFNNIDELTL